VSQVVGNGNVYSAKVPLAIVIPTRAPSSSCTLVCMWPLTQFAPHPASHNCVSATRFSHLPRSHVTPCLSYDSRTFMAKDDRDGNGFSVLCTLLLRIEISV